MCPQMNLYFSSAFPNNQRETGENEIVLLLFLDESEPYLFSESVSSLDWICALFRAIKPLPWIFTEDSYLRHHLPCCWFRIPLCCWKIVLFVLWKLIFHSSILPFFHIFMRVLMVPIIEEHVQDFGKNIFLDFITARYHVAQQFPLKSINQFR